MTKEISCRLIQPEDYQAMSAIIIKFLYEESLVRQKTQDASDIKNLFVNEKFLGYYVLLETDTDTGKTKVIGGAGFQECKYTEENHPKTCELRRFYIDSDYRGASYGKYFLNCLVDFVKRQGFQRILLETVPGKMDRAINLYSKVGFFKTQNRPLHCADKTGERGHLFMELTLNKPGHLLRSKM
jgi:putative acetyltransferase